MNIQDISNRQRKYFNTGVTKSIVYRKQSLIDLKNTIKKYEEDILYALNLDLNKSKFEAYATEIGQVYNELNYMIKNIERLAKPKKVSGTFIDFYSKGTIYSEPYGQVLIVAPWNYPFNLAMIPLIGSISGGNVTVLKPSNYSNNTSIIIEKIIKECFDEGFVKVVLGSREENEGLLDHKFDYIFFTGSKEVGKIVMNKASKNLIPVTLELGGKSPVIIDRTANIKLAAKRVMFGKLINAGQTCVAPDYLFIHKSKKDEFIREYKKNVILSYGEKTLENENYPKIISAKHFIRIRNCMNDEKIIFGGDANGRKLKIEPTLIEVTNVNSKIMTEEIFGPVLPIITYENIYDVINFINKRPKALALYLFTEDENMKKLIINSISYGGGAINDTLMHVANHKLPFGGVGESGMGKYHGDSSFDAFTNKKSVLEKTTKFDIPLRYAPYRESTFNLIKKILK